MAKQETSHSAGVRSAYALEAEIAELRAQLEVAQTAASLALEAAEGWRQAAAESQAREARLRSMFLLLAEFTTPLPGFSMEGLCKQFTEMQQDDRALVEYGRQQRNRDIDALRALPWPVHLEDAVAALRAQDTGAHIAAPTVIPAPHLTEQDVDLSYIDPEASHSEERALHLVSGTTAGRAYNDLCRLLGGRFPDCRLQEEAPVAHKFFMALLTPHNVAECANSPRAAA